MDATSDLICPAIRARRLLEAVCAAGASPGCTLDPAVEGAVAALENGAKSQGDCLKERTRPAVELAFIPMPLPEGE